MNNDINITDIYSFPRINPDNKKDVEDYYLGRIREVSDKKYTSMVRNFEPGTGSILDIFNGGNHIGFIDYEEGLCDVYVDVENTESGGRVLNRESLPFEAASMLMHSYVMGEYIELPTFSAHPHPEIDFGNL